MVISPALLFDACIAYSGLGLSWCLHRAYLETRMCITGQVNPYLVDESIANELAPVIRHMSEKIQTMTVPVRIMAGTILTVRAITTNIIGGLLWPRGLYRVIHRLVDIKMRHE